MYPDRKNLLLYVAKCITATVIVFLVARVFQDQDVIWPLVSAILVLSPDNQEALPLATARIKANVMASVVALVCLLPGPANLVTINIALALTIGLCSLFRLMDGSRSALAAVIIIMLHEPGKHLWDAAAERAGTVIAGCVLGLLITLAFHRRLDSRASASRADKSE
ncbi:MAG TPA: aromatic acid exporter family protein [Pirellulales bacterium]